MRLLLACFLIAVVVVLALRMTAVGDEGKKSADPQIAHMVYFALKDNSPEAKKKLVDACKKYLKGHDGTVFFGTGVIAEEFKRPVNDRDWDVSLHLVFKDKAAHDKYQEHERHKQFIEENKDNWKKVRVFDSELAPE
jgi:hypothetical protein